MWIVLSVNSGTSASSARQAAAKVSRSASSQWRFAPSSSAGRGALHRADEPNAAFDLAVVEHEARRGDLHGGAAGLRSLISSLRAAICETIERLVERDGPIALALRDGKEPGFGAVPGWI